MTAQNVDIQAPEPTRSAVSERLAWNWRDQIVRLGLDRVGEGPPVLLLPALSSISTRGEMRSLQERLSARFLARFR